MVINLILTPLFQKEIPSKKIIYITLIVLLGTMITTIFSPKDHSNYTTVSQVLDLYYTVYFMLYLIIVGVPMIGLLIFHNYCIKFKAKYGKEYERKFFKTHRFGCAALSGIMGAQNILFAKGVSTMIVFSVEDRNKLCFLYWEWYVLLISMLISVWFQLKWLNYGLRYFSQCRLYQFSNHFGS